MATQYHPYVSVICVTFNRRPFFPAFFECMRAQTYPKKRFEIIIVDDGTDCVRDAVDTYGYGLTVKYHRIEHKMTLGAKRNLSHTFIHKNTKYIVAADDDDYHCRERIAHSVEMLEKTPDAMIAGASTLYVYFKHIQKMYQFGPYMAGQPDGTNTDRFSPRNTHSTNGCFAYRRALAETRQYSDDACIAEEHTFLAEYTIPMIQLDPMKTILVVSHEHNTYDKRNLLKDPNPDYVKLSMKTIDMFITSPSIRQFFMIDIDPLLERYEPGHPRMKPDVLKQIQELDAERNKMMQQMQSQQQLQLQQQQQQQNGGGFGQDIMTNIMFNEPGKPPRPLHSNEVVQMIQQLQSQVEYYTKYTADLEQKYTALQNEHLDAMYKRSVST